MADLSTIFTGIRFENPYLLREVVRRKVPLEIGISSNVRSKALKDFSSHPALHFFRAGVPITFNTDDRGVIGIDLTNEYGSALRLGFTVEELARISAASVDHLFLPPDQREKMRREFEAQNRVILSEAAATL